MPEVRTLCDIFTNAAASGKPDLLLSKVAGEWRPISASDFGFTVRAFSLGLNSLGIQPGDRVAILSENRPEWAAVFWGCVLRGVVVVPIDEKHSIDFAHRVASRTRARLAYLGDTQPDTFGDLAVRRLRDIAWTTKVSAGGYTPEPIAPESPVQILFTSGATAEPKGVVISHRNILANIIPIEREIEKYRRYERPFHPIRRWLHARRFRLFGRSALRRVIRSRRNGAFHCQ